jgi:hypothetical protein
MNIETLKAKTANIVGEDKIHMQIRVPKVTDENRKDYEKWLKQTEKLGIGFGKYDELFQGKRE